MADRINLEQGSQEWLDYRRMKIGSSDTPIICGVSPYKTKMQLWRDKMGLAEGYQTEAMKMGHELEKSLRTRLSSFLQKEYTPAVFQSLKFPYLLASLDGYHEESGEVIEIKSTNTNNYESMIGKPIPQHYNYQCQHQMIVMDVYFVSLFVTDGIGYFYTLVKRNEEIQNEIICEGKKFYDSLVNCDRPDGAVERFEEEGNFLRYFELQRLIKDMEMECDEIKARMVDRSKGEPLYCGPYSLCKHYRRGNIDYKTIPVLHDLDLEPYRKEGSDVWSLKTSIRD